MEIRETIFNNLDFNKCYPEYDPEIQEILVVSRTSWVLMMLVLLHFQAL